MSSSATVAAKREQRFWTRSHTLTLASILIFIGLCVGIVSTAMPWEDESWFGSATYNLMSHGELRTSIIEGAGTWRAGTKHHLYWEPPLSFIADAMFCSVASFSVFSIRTVSLLFGLFGLACCWALVRRGAGSAQVAALAVLITSSDYFYLTIASDGRMDMMCFATGFAGAVSYLLLRERNLALAVVVSQAFVVISGITHPNGILWFAVVAALTLLHDRRNITPRIFLLACIPYVLGAAVWGFFIVQDPREFVFQFRSNMRESSSSNSQNISPILSPIRGIIAELNDRYLGPYGLLPGVPLINRTKAAILLIYAAVVAICVSVKEIRRRAFVRDILLMTAIIFLGLMFVTGNKWYHYLVHIIPLWAILAAVVFTHYGTARGFPRYASLAAIALLVCVGWAGALHNIRQNTYKNLYVPAAQFIAANTQQNDLVVGPAGFWWALRDSREIKDDKNFGYYSHRTARMIVLDDWYRYILSGGPENIRTYARSLLRDQYRLAWSRGNLDFYVRNSASAAQK